MMNVRLLGAMLRKNVLSSKCREQRLEFVEVTVGDMNPQEFHYEADQSVGAEGEDGLKNQQEPTNLVVEGLEEQLEELGDECSTRSMDVERLAGLRLDVGSARG